MVSDVIGDYEVIDELGSGAVGVAFKARHPETGDTVALKLLHDRLAADPEIQNRFVREVSVLEKLDHPNIVRHLDCGLDDGRLYYAMEWVECGTLEEILRRRQRLPWREAVECAIQICDGLAHAHERGIIHRDLKPANLFLAADGHVKIGDFGLARDESLHRLTMAGNTVGSCRYMAPEQVRGEAHLTGAVDLYALGCLLFRMLAGRPPYDGASIMEIFEHHLFSDIPKLDRGEEDRPQALDDLVHRLLAKDVARRPSEALEVKAALEAILAGGEVQADFTTAADSSTSPEVENPAPNLTERLLELADGEKENGISGKVVVIIGILVMLAVIVFIASGR